MNGTQSLALRAIAAQAQIELLLALRRGESVLVTMVIPALLLVFFASVGAAPTGFGRGIAWLLPGMLALAVMSTSFVSLGIATAYERHYGVLKRLGGTPLSRGGLLVAKLFAVLAIELVQVALLLAIAALAYHWQPTAGLPALLPGLLLGTAAFAGLGLAMAGALRAEATLAGANGLYLVLLLLGGIVFPVEQLPGALATVAGILPATALAEVLRGTLTPGAALPLQPLALLTIWAVAMVVTAARTFKWE